MMHAKSGRVCEKCEELLAFNTLLKRLGVIKWYNIHGWFGTSITGFSYTLCERLRNV